jgi:hypothetical protein
MPLEKKKKKKKRKRYPQKNQSDARFFCSQGPFVTIWDDEWEKFKSFEHLYRGLCWIWFRHMSDGAISKLSGSFPSSVPGERPLRTIIFD